MTQPPRKQRKAGPPAEAPAGTPPLVLCRMPAEQGSAHEAVGGAGGVDATGGAAARVMTDTEKGACSAASRGTVNGSVESAGGAAAVEC